MLRNLSTPSPAHGLANFANSLRSPVTCLRNRKDRLESALPQRRRPFSASRTRKKTAYPFRRRSEDYWEIKPAPTVEVPERETLESMVPSMQTTLKIPHEFTALLRNDEIADASYVPADTAEGLETVGGLDDWFEKDENWSEAHSPALLLFRAPGVAVGQNNKTETIAALRRALVEALVVSRANREWLTLTGAWSVGGEDAKLRVQNVQVEVSKEGFATLASGAEAEAAIEAVLDDLSGTSVPAQEQGARPAADEEADAPLDATANCLSESLAPDQEQTASPAGKFDKPSGLGNKLGRISLADPTFKFAVVKRLLQLTGHMIPDVKLMSIPTVGRLLGLVVKEPKPKKFVEQLLKAKPELKLLDNVSIKDRRIKPIDKHKSLGRWKVIVQELERRKIPALGQGNFSKDREIAWATGGT